MTESTHDLPYIDEYRQRIEAPPDAIWGAILKVVRGHTRGGEKLAGLLGCDPRKGTADFSGQVGQAVPGFRITESEPPRRLVLRGRHRFADYALTFLLEGETLRAQTHAAFPGFWGRLYRAAVIGSGGHRLVTKYFLRKVAEKA